MNVLNVFFDTKHLEPKQSCLNAHLKILGNADVSGVFYELRTYEGINDDLLELINGPLKLDEFMERMEDAIPELICSPCITEVLGFCQEYGIPVYAFGGNGVEDEYLTNIRNLLWKGIKRGNYLLNIGFLHEDFFNEKLKPLFDKYFDKVVQSFYPEKWWLK